MKLNTIRPETRLYLAAALLGVAVTLAALVLAVGARDHRRTATRLAHDDLALAGSVAEIRALTVQIQLDTTRGTLLPEQTAAARVGAVRARLADELRRARLHSHDHNTVDVIDDLENRLLSYSEAAEALVASGASRPPEQARAALVALDQQASQVTELADELTTVTASAVEQRTLALGDGGRVGALLALAGGALVLALTAVGRAVDGLRQPRAVTPAASTERAPDEESLSFSADTRPADGATTPSGDELAGWETAWPAPVEQPAEMQSYSLSPLPTVAAAPNPPAAAASDSPNQPDVESAPTPMWQPKSLQKPAADSAA